VERARVEAGQTVVIFGAGPLGCLLAMAVTARKARPIVVGKPGWRLERVRALGIGDCLDAGGGPDVLAAIRTAADGAVDVTIDATGKPEVWEQAVDAVDRGGCVVFFGGCAPGTFVRLGTRRVHYEELSLLGAFHHTPTMIRYAVDLVESGAIVPDGLLTHRMGLTDVREGLRLMETGEALKVLIEP
jgi:L-iditol 2-dehydrogenase